jgi:hypothetical protein
VRICVVTVTPRCNFARQATALPTGYLSPAEALAMTAQSRAARHEGWELAAAIGASVLGKQRHT